MDTRRFGRKIKLPATIAIKHQVRKLMFEEASGRQRRKQELKEFPDRLREETRRLAHRAEA